MGAGLHFETQEEIEKIQEDAPNDPNTTGQKEPPCEEEGGNPKKRKTRKVSSKAFCLVLDNASSNDACITELFATTPIQDDLPVDGKVFHQRCGCHILNLIVQDGLSVLKDEISNIRDTMKYIKHSQGRMEKFKLACSQSQIPFKKPAWDVPTRWNSTYLMLVLALELKPAICRYGNIDKRCKLYVVEYYMKELCPEQCANFMANLRECMKELFNEYVQENASDEKQGRVSKRQKTTAVAGASGSGTNSRAALKDYIKERRNNEPQKSELDDYLATELDEASVDEDFDILAWWRLKSPKYPILCQLTKDILAVPISTVASESAFSTSGRILSPARSSLNDESIEALLCAQDWLRASINENGEKIGEPLWNIEEGGGIEE
ncbi:hypothetical protein LUZ61_010692 [Rhynchospora tenuis]|uniref:HAT C-terminal dimerisation domain-containing protein n=1 Tax=Rhynchospora tenuis TaxID=198213 RepID=A0AAD5ZZQ0_9POAL|nr:hypothetical protein LUZ61_010692 [Rhynchospora tenuis]